MDSKIMLKNFLVILFVHLSGKIVVSVKKGECGYKQCPQTREGALNVHLIPHSHMDAGWVKTFDEYYYGTRTSISTANVQLIYHSVLTELLHDRRRKFTFSESGYFWRWWKEQRPATRSTFRGLVQEGRVEFAGGGWVQNDEAVVDYLAIIDQFTWGLRKLNDTLGPCGKPKAAWQIDTYGHAREQTSLLAQMGFDGLFIGRVDHKEREAMIEEDRMEFMWRGSDVLGKMSDIMTHTLFNLYNAPEGFCFDFLCNDEPIMDDPDGRAFNADKRVNDFIAQIERQAKYYDHDNILVTMGGDFTYQSAANWFMNIDKVINHVTTHPANMSDLNIFYSTPSCYLKALYLYGKRDKAVYTEKGDQLPYGSDGTTYWTGYFTSRPSLKYLVKRGHAFLQVVKQLTVISRSPDSYELHLLRHAVSLALHHDAVTGTSQQHVVNDFVRMLSEAIDSCTKKVSNFISALTPTWGGTRRTKNQQQFMVCHQLNISQCRFSETQESMLVLVYNPSSYKTYHYIRLPAVALHFNIRDPNDEEVEYQLVRLPSPVLDLPGRRSSALQELYFEAENIPPLGFSAFYVSAVRDLLKENDFARRTTTPVAETDHELVPVISNEYIKVTIDKDTGLLESIHHVDGIKIMASQNFLSYNQGPAPNSGAYCFRSREPPIPVTTRASYYTVRGSLVKEIRQRFTDWLFQTIRLYRGEDFVEFEWVVGPVPVGTADQGKEIVSKFTTNITTHGTFFTDSNGRQMMKRSCWNDSTGLPQKKRVEACYYPVTSRICIRSLNSSAEMCVLPDRAQGGTSYDDGDVELMIHRRLLTDDGFGLEEPLNEEEHGAGLVVRGKHRLIVGNYRQETIDEQTFSERSALAARRWSQEPWVFLTSGEKVNRRKWQNVRNKKYSGLRQHALPRHINVLTLEPWKAGSVLLRLENTLEKSLQDRFKNDKNDGGDGPDMRNSHITVDLRKIFLQLEIRSFRETTLAANQWLDAARQMDWSTRYVYTGGNDGILPEDNADYADENKPLKRDSAHYSDEDVDYQVKTNPIKPRSDRVRTLVKRQPGYELNRRKRSINSSDDIENMINRTDLHRLDKFDFVFAKMNDEITTGYDSGDFYFETTTPTKVDDKLVNFTKSHTTIQESTRSTGFDTNAYLKVTKKSPRLSFLTSTVQYERSKDLTDVWSKRSGEMTSSEEDFSFNLKRKSLKKKHVPRTVKPRKLLRKPELSDTTEDDDVTKSIYEMYYKTRPRQHSFKPYIRESSEEDTLYDRPYARMRRKPGFPMDYDCLDDKPKSHDILEDKSTWRKERKLKRRYNHGRHVKDVEDYERKETQYKKNINTNEMKLNHSNGHDSTEDLKDGHKYISASNRKQHRNFDYDVESPEKETDNEGVRGGERPEGMRTKRSSLKTTDARAQDSSEAEDAGHQEYLVTLRPTQIRTFVVWFESSRKPYTL